jgi:small nuclear ribonucleoprotein (snRNP)-like protein
MNFWIGLSVFLMSSFFILAFERFLFVKEVYNSLAENNKMKDKLMKITGNMVSFDSHGEIVLGNIEEMEVEQEEENEVEKEEENEEENEVEQEEENEIEQEEENEVEQGEENEEENEIDMEDENSNEIEIEDEHPNEMKTDDYVAGKEDKSEEIILGEEQAKQTPNDEV